MDDDDLNRFFDAARQSAPEPSPSLRARIVADAERERDALRAPIPPGRSKSNAGWRAFLDVLGGWPALGGLATATVAGVWIGVSEPLGVAPLDLVSDVIAIGADDLETGYGDFAWSME